MWQSNYLHVSWSQTEQIWEVIPLQAPEGGSVTNIPHSQSFKGPNIETYLFQHLIMISEKKPAIKINGQKLCKWTNISWAHSSSQHCFISVSAWLL